MISNDELPSEEASPIPEEVSSEAVSEAADELESDISDSEFETDSASYPDVSVIYVTHEASEVFAVVVDEPYEPEYLDYNIIFGVIFGFYLIVRLMAFVRKALFVRFDGNKEA